MKFFYKNGCNEYLQRFAHLKGIHTYTTRRSFVNKYSWAIPNAEALQTILKHSPILEIGAGNGYWGKLLHLMGADIVSTDLKPGAGYGFTGTVFSVEKLSSVKAVRKFRGRTLFCVWPCCNKEWCYDALKEYRGDTFIYIGETRGGCTGCDSLHDELGIHWETERKIEIPQWPGLHDELVVFKRKEAKQ